MQHIHYRTHPFLTFLPFRKYTRFHFLHSIYFSLPFLSSFLCLKIIMDRQSCRKQAKITKDQECEEVSSVEWEVINMTEQEEDLIYRMYRLVGERWDLIAGRIPGRKAEEIERFWIMRHCEGFAERRKEQKKKTPKTIWSLAFNAFK